ncbi:MAG: hypothetical protein ACPG4U_09545 [Pseudomonadales bacterium]
MTKKDSTKTQEAFDEYCQKEGLHDLDETTAAVLKGALEDPEGTDIFTVDLDEIRAKGGIEHLGLPKEIEDDLMQQLINDGVFTTH